MENKTNSEIVSYEEILKQSANKQKTGKNFKKTYPAFIVLVLMISLSFFIKDLFKNKVNNETQATFNKAVNSVMLRVDNKYRSNLQVLTSIQGLYDAYIDVVRDYFKLYSSVPTSTNSSIKSLMYIEAIASADLDNHVFNMQRQGLWDYKIHPTSKSDLYYPVAFIEPLDPNINNAGFDFNSNEQIKYAIELSRDDNKVVATNVMQTLCNTESEGFYIIAPVYKQNTSRGNIEDRRKNFKGVVVQEIAVDKFFKDALGGNFPADTSIIFEFIERDGTKESRIFASKNIELLKENYVPISSKEIFHVADKHLEVRFYTVPNFIDWFSAHLEWISFSVSMLLSLAFFGFMLSVITSRARALDLAERMTRSQRRIVDSSQDIIAVLDFNGNWKSMNPASDTIFGLSSASMIGNSINSLLIEEDDIQKFKTMFNSAIDESTERIDYQMKSSNGDIKWVNWSFTISKSDSLIYAIGRDVTLEKIAEEQAKLRSKQMQLAEQFTREASEFKSYFMTKLSHQMRNSLTGIAGYLQLVSSKIYESEEELDAYIASAEESSDELFTFVSDMIEVAIGSGDAASSSLTTNSLDIILKDATAKLVEMLPLEKSIKVSMMDDNIIPKVVADRRLLLSAFVQIFNSISEGNTETDIQIAATENPYEGATEVQMMTNANPLVAEMIGIYKANTNSIIEVLSKDKKDILLNMAIGASIIRMMNGTMTVETFGADEGNIVQITLPLNKKGNA